MPAKPCALPAGLRRRAALQSCVRTAGAPREARSEHLDRVAPNGTAPRAPPPAPPPVGHVPPCRRSSPAPLPAADKLPPCRRAVRREPLPVAGRPGSPREEARRVRGRADGGRGRRPVVERGARRGAQPFDHPDISSAAQRFEMRRDQARRRALRIEARERPRDARRLARRWSSCARPRAARSDAGSAQACPRRAPRPSPARPRAVWLGSSRCPPPPPRGEGRNPLRASPVPAPSAARPGRGSADARGSASPTAVDAADPNEVLERAQLAQVRGSLDGAEQFPKIEGIPARGAVGERANVLVHGYAASVQDCRHGLRAEQGRPNHRRSRTHDGQRPRTGCGVLGSQRRDECNARSVEARR